LKALKALADTFLSLDAEALDRASAAGEISEVRSMAKTTNKSDSGILGTVHKTAVGLRRAGVIDKATMREFDALCLTPVSPMAPEEIKALREREQVSQPVFARYLNVRKDAVSKWERGEKRPDGPSLKLLNLVRTKGLQSIA